MLNQHCLICPIGFAYALTRLFGAHLRTRRGGSVKRSGGLPPLPFVAYTLLRQKSAAEASDNALSSRAPGAKTTRARTLLLPDPEPHATAVPRAPPSTGQCVGDGWMEDDTTVLWHVAEFEEMNYSKR